MVFGDPSDSDEKVIENVYNDRALRVWLAVTFFGDVRKFAGAGKTRLKPAAKPTGSEGSLTASLALSD